MGQSENRHVATPSGKRHIRIVRLGNQLLRKLTKHADMAIGLPSNRAAP